MGESRNAGWRGARIRSSAWRAVMRFPSSLVLLVLATLGCGDDDSGGGIDAPGAVGPRVIAGGGIGDGPIDGVAFIHVIDDATRMPVSGATVRVGTVDGTTDAAGLFTA